MSRVRVAGVTGAITPDLAAAVVAELGRRAGAAERSDIRNELLRQAAELVSGTRYAKAKRLEREALAAKSGRRAADADVDGVRPLVERALEVDPEMPTSWRQMERILDV
ncbi:hypothetical protein F0U61_32495 [Archangium violaceum]|uniref:hypothetical protein n=1 Tax=Archangium violaceum TaxID=83451 RepID=UPI002B3204BC|nr:hypothetical protein F0U61_32495 [Archangium violaceum]